MPRPLPAVVSIVVVALLFTGWVACLTWRGLERGERLAPAPSSSPAKEDNRVGLEFGGESGEQPTLEPAEHRAPPGPAREPAATRGPGKMLEGAVLSSSDFEASSSRLEDLFSPVGDLLAERVAEVLTDLPDDFWEAWPSYGFVRAARGASLVSQLFPTVVASELGPRILAAPEGLELWEHHQERAHRQAVLLILLQHLERPGDRAGLEEELARCRGELDEIRARIFSLAGPDVAFLEALASAY